MQAASTMQPNSCVRAMLAFAVVASVPAAALRLSQNCPCALPPLTVDHTLISYHDAQVEPHNVYTRMTIGGSLQSLTQGSKAADGLVTVGGSYLPKFERQWNFNKNPEPKTQPVSAAFSTVFDWSDFESLAKRIVPGQYENGQKGQPCDDFYVFVLTKGGTFNLQSFHTNSQCRNNAQGEDNGRTLVVFNTEEPVTLEGKGGRQFGPSVLAPFSTVTLASNAGFLDGFLVANNSIMLGSQNQLHGDAYAGPLECRCASPTATPTSSPTTESPTASPTASPTQSPSASPTRNPTSSPTSSPTTNPTGNPTLSPTASPTGSPSASPTPSPTESPTSSPTSTPTASPTGNPTSTPTATPTRSPSASPTPNPTDIPTGSPTASPTGSPTDSPSLSPTPSPTALPTPSPTSHSVTGTGDPHLENVRAERFDLRRTGNHTLLMLPRGGKEETAVLQLLGEVTTPGDVCAGKLYITGLALSGSWLGSLRRLRFSTGGEAFNTPEVVGLSVGSSGNLSLAEFVAVVPETMVRVHQPAGPLEEVQAVNHHVTMLSIGLRFGPGVVVQISWVHQKEKVGFSNWLQLTASGLGQAKMRAGGLLGEDDHRAVESLPEECSGKLVIGTHPRPGSASRLRAAAAAAAAAADATCAARASLRRGAAAW